MARITFLAGLLLGAATLAGPAKAIDWASIPAKDVVVFYPGQTSWEFLLTPDDHGGAAKFREGKDCHECHRGEEVQKGAEIASGKKNEPTPIPGKPGSIPVHVKVAHDDQFFYLHVEFDEGNQPDTKMDPKVATRVNFMLNDGGVPEANRAGCWGACHDDVRGMASAGTSERTKYLSRSRVKITRQGGGDDLKSADDLAKLRASGYYLEYWQAQLNPGAKPVAVDGTILEKRAENPAPAIAAEAEYKNGTWSVTLSRKLVAGMPYKDIVAGKTYTFGLAIHAGHANHRFHYVSLENTLVLDQGNADFVAAKK